MSHLDKTLTEKIFQRLKAALLVIIVGLALLWALPGLQFLSGIAGSSRVSAKTQFNRIREYDPIANDTVLTPLLNLLTPGTLCVQDLAFTVSAVAVDDRDQKSFVSFAHPYGPPPTAIELSSTRKSDFDLVAIAQLGQIRELATNRRISQGSLADSIHWSMLLNGEHNQQTVQEIRLALTTSGMTFSLIPLETFLNPVRYPIRVPAESKVIFSHCDPDSSIVDSFLVEMGIDDNLESLWTKDRWDSQSCDFDQPCCLFTRNGVTWRVWETNARSPSFMICQRETPLALGNQK